MFQSFASLGELIPKYFIVFDGTIVNDIIFFNSFSDSLLLVCRNTTYFCMLIFLKIYLFIYLFLFFF